MSFKIDLNNLDYRYDIYQMFNLFADYNDIEFVNDGFDFRIDIREEDLFIEGFGKTRKFSLTDEANKKQAVRRNVFSFLKSETDRELPWGTLVGIRPSKIALKLINDGLSEEQIIGYYKEHYLTRSDKAELCIKIAKAERERVNRDSRTVSVYIGMPFCPTRCLYCSFASNPIGKCKKLIKPYLDALMYDIKKTAEYISNRKLKIECVYFGGGTPTSVSDDEFKEAMECIYENLIKDHDVREFTVECGRPDSITADKLITMKSCNVDRISINPQTMNDETLKFIGRNHSACDIVEKFELARNIGFDNINMDIIVGLPYEGIEAVKNTCREILKLSPDSVTVHGLCVKRGSRLHENILASRKYKSISQNEINSMYDETVELSKRLHMNPYYMYKQKNMVGNMENVGYAAKGKEGIYNIQMIEEKQTIIGIGADAVTKVVFLDEDRIERFADVKDVNEYINRIAEMLKKKTQLLDTLYNHLNYL